ncbi:GIY-YIG nuclease family protein [Staphylococcus saprophyticus]|uniref:GIY-YIG nuclease family protein n=1 Tax=Staphylococcus saprophyticus TaxID=29385 RepID=UPI000D1F55E0|nr:GIY-YIG nuclease family protein [Staphylococcus saprophyticus]PTK12128.1 hypothetical protein BUZ75_07055 [Staphylococcus saprophyticus]PTK45487.1 hypothetical protein BUZ69_10225 [Staphylococcus saprophyticus]
MNNGLDSIFEDSIFDKLTKQEDKIKVEKLDPELIKFQKIVDFVKENGREPKKTKEWSNERALWASLSGFRNKPERFEKVRKYDSLNILGKENDANNKFEIDTNELKKPKNLEEVIDKDELIDDFSDLLDVSRYRKTINAADKIERRKNIPDFEKYKILFEQVHEDIATGRRKIIPFEQYDIEEGRFYIQNGVMMYIVSIGNFYTDNHNSANAKMHVVYENGTANKSLLFRSLASSLYSKERHGRMVTDIIDDNTMAEKFNQSYTTGYIYVLQSLSADQEIKKLKNLYKIGFTRNDIKQRITNAENDVTYLNAPVRLILSAKVENINAQLLERTLHHTFRDKQVIFQNENFKNATEWFIVPLDEIHTKINEIVASLQK